MGGQSEAFSSSASLQRVLVVDDDPDLRLLLGEFLAMERLLVEEAGSLAEALARLEKGPLPELILSDHYLGDGTGMDLLGRLGKAAVRTPVIVITAMGAGDTYRREARDAGAFGCWEKLTSLRELGELVRRALGRGGNGKTDDEGGVRGAGVESQ